MSETQVSYEVTDSTKTGSTSTLHSYYQSFIPSETFEVKAWQIYIDSIVSGSARASIWFYNADADGKPTGTELGGAGPIASLYTSNTGWQGTSTSVYPELTAGSRYCIRIQGKVTSGSYEFAFDSNDGYADGTAWYWNGSAFVAQNGDISFRIIGDLVPQAPSKPTTPAPANNATKVDFSGFGLSWADGGGADTYDVWIGPSGSLVKVSAAQGGTSYTTNIGEVPLNQKVYWRIDATNDTGTTTGDTWNFDARPGKASVFTPADEATGITLDDTTGVWESPSANTTSYRVLYGTLSGFLSEVGTTSDLSLALVDGNFDQYGDIYYWRVDATNAFGTTQGDELWFTTIIFYPAQISYRLISGGNGDGPYDDPPGTQGTDWEYTGLNNMITVGRLVVAANSKIFYENI